MILWLCKMCGNKIEGAEMPHTCPSCKGTFNLRLLSEPNKEEMLKIREALYLHPALTLLVNRFIMSLDNIKLDAPADRLDKQELIQMLETFVVKKKGLGQGRKEGN